MSNPLDRLYAEAGAGIGGFRFDEAVASVFPDMIARSVPGYATIVAQSGVLAARYAKHDTTLYDLGSSLGATCLAMQSAIGRLGGNGKAREGVEIVGVEQSAAMLVRCRDDWYDPVEEASRDVPIRLVEADIETFDYAPASVIAMNFTLQFVAAEHRAALLHRLANTLVAGGILILSEKVAFADADEQTLQNDWHHAFKAANGYSELEIARKRTALEGVLQPDDHDTHVERLHDAGFNQVLRWFQCFNFVSMIAMKV